LEGLAKMQLAQVEVSIVVVALTLVGEQEDRLMVEE